MFIRIYRHCHVFEADTAVWVLCGEATWGVGFNNSEEYLATTKRSTEHEYAMPTFLWFENPSENPDVLIKKIFQEQCCHACCSLGFRVLRYDTPYLIEMPCVQSKAFISCSWFSSLILGGMWRLTEYKENEKCVWNVICHRVDVARNLFRHQIFSENIFPLTSSLYLIYKIFRIL